MQCSQPSPSAVINKVRQSVQLVRKILQCQALGTRSQHEDLELWAGTLQRLSHKTTGPPIHKLFPHVRKLQLISWGFLHLCPQSLAGRKECWLISVRQRNRRLLRQDCSKSHCSQPVMSKASPPILTLVLWVARKVSKFLFLGQKCKGLTVNSNWKSTSIEMLDPEATQNQQAPLSRLWTLRWLSWGISTGQSSISNSTTKQSGSFQQPTWFNQTRKSWSVRALTTLKSPKST